MDALPRTEVIASFANVSLRTFNTAAPIRSTSLTVVEYFRASPACTAISRAFMFDLIPAYLTRLQLAFVDAVEQRIEKQKP